MYTLEYIISQHGLGHVNADMAIYVLAKEVQRLKEAIFPEQESLFPKKEPEKAILDPGLEPESGLNSPFRFVTVRREDLEYLFNMRNKSISQALSTPTVAWEKYVECMNRLKAALEE